ncbi:MAG: Ig-like domain-containing protein [Lachnospiraceae bacterium]|nr:Ig-like domain-containing protein [Lachnospiraceae bacterium]
MRLVKKTCALALAATMTLSVAVPTTVSAAKVKISKKKITISVGESKTLTVKKGKKAVKKVKWKTSNKKVATVKKGTVTGKKAGKAVISAVVGKKAYKCTVTVKAKATKKSGANTTTSTQPSNTATPTQPSNTTTPTQPSNTTTPVKPSETPTSSGDNQTKPVSDFSFKDDVTIEYGTKDKYVEFEMKKDGSGKVSEEEKTELLRLGFEIDEEKGVASKMQQCESVKYTFKKLPKTVDDIKSFFAEPEKDDVPNDENAEYVGFNYGGFNAMAATICAACTFQGGSNPADPFFSKDPVREMFEYINGPSSQMDIAKSQMDNAISSMKEAIKVCGPNVYKSYFNGATDTNNYTPDEPYVLEMYKGPYYIAEKETITGTRPTTYMILVKSGGADAERYIDVYYSTKDKRWYSYQNQFMHITANDFKKPKEEL